MLIPSRKVSNRLQTYSTTSILAPKAALPRRDLKYDGGSSKFTVSINNYSALMTYEMGREYIKKTKQRIQQEDLDSNPSKLSVFHHLLTSNIPESEKSTSRLQAEAMVILIAGTFTGAHILAMIVYHALSDPSIERRLREELKVTMSSYPTRTPRVADLEGIPYLQACIKEALR